MAKKYKRAVQVIEIAISDEVVAQLETIDHELEYPLQHYINAYYDIFLEEYPYVDILHKGNHYMVTEDNIYLAVYKDELSWKFKITNIMKKLKEKFGSKDNSQ